MYVLLLDDTIPKQIFFLDFFDDCKKKYCINNPVNN